MSHTVTYFSSSIIAGLRSLACWDRGFESHPGTDVCCVLSGRVLCSKWWRI